MPDPMLLQRFVVQPYRGCRIIQRIADVRPAKTFVIIRTGGIEVEMAIAPLTAAVDHRLLQLPAYPRPR